MFAAAQAARASAINNTGEDTEYGMRWS
jgi:hypothetical protein